MKQITLPIFIASMLAMIAYGITRAQVVNEQYSVNLGQQGRPETTVVYEFTLQHTDGSRLPIKLVTFKQKCKTTPDGDLCYGGFTEFKSDNARKNDVEHPVDTQEAIYMDFTKKGKVPVVKMDELLHELHHAVQYHWMSRDICETNWRYSDCLERLAYDYQGLYNQLIQLQKKGRIILK